MGSPFLAIRWWWHRRKALRSMRRILGPARYASSGRPPTTEVEQLEQFFWPAKERR